MLEITTHTYGVVDRLTKGSISQDTTGTQIVKNLENGLIVSLETLKRAVEIVEYSDNISLLMHATTHNIPPIVKSTAWASDFSNYNVPTSKLNFYKDKIINLFTMTTKIEGNKVIIIFNFANPTKK